MIRKTIFSCLMFLNWMFISSCNVMNSGDPLPGKIVVSNSQEHKYFIYINSDIPKYSFKLKYDNEAKQSGLTWLNTKNTFIGNDGIPGLTQMEYRCDIVEFDIAGKISDRIYEAEKGELAWPWYSSWDDKYLIFTTKKKMDPKMYPFEGLAPMLSLNIMDLELKKVITKIDSIGRFPNFQIEESPWLYSGYRFVYSIYSTSQLKLKGEGKVINPVKAIEGVYVCDISLGKRKLLVPDGFSAIASPTRNQIAYEKDNSIRVLDLETNEEQIVYKYSSKEQLFDKHWTPDGRYIYIAYKYNWGIGDLFHTGEKLIEISSGKEVEFKKIGHGFGIYTWK